MHFDRDRQDGSSFGGSSFEGYPKAAFPANAEAIPNSLWIVELSKKLTTKVAMPREGDLHSMQIDDQGSPYFFSLVEISRNWNESDYAKVKKTKKVSYNGKSYDYPFEDGVPAIAIAQKYVSTTKSWVKVETAPTHTGWDYALGVDSLETIRSCCGRIKMYSDDWSTGDLEAFKEKTRSVSSEINKLQPGRNADSGEWTLWQSKISKTQNDVLIWGIVGEFLHNTGLFVFLSGKKIITPQKSGFNASNTPSYQFVDKLMLVTSMSLGTHPRLYDVDTGRLVFEHDKIFGVNFWNKIVLQKN